MPSANPTCEALMNERGDSAPQPPLLSNWHASVEEKGASSGFPEVAGDGASTAAESDVVHARDRATRLFSSAVRFERNCSPTTKPPKPKV